MAAPALVSPSLSAAAPAREDRFHVKFIIEHNDKPAEIDIKSGNHSTNFFRRMWSYINMLENSHLHHRCVSNLRWGQLAPNRRDVSYIVRFVPLRRFTVNMYIDYERKLEPLELHTDDPTEILPWVERQGRRLLADTFCFYPCKGFTCTGLWDYYDETKPEQLAAILAELPAFLERQEAFQKGRLGRTYESMFVVFCAEEK